MPLKGQGHYFSLRVWVQNGKKACHSKYSPFSSRPSAFRVPGVVDFVHSEGLAGPQWSPVAVVVGGSSLIVWSQRVCVFLNVFVCLQTVGSRWWVVNMNPPPPPPHSLQSAAMQPNPHSVIEAPPPCSDTRGLCPRMKARDAPQVLLTWGGPDPLSGLVAENCKGKVSACEVCETGQRCFFSVAFTWRPVLPEPVFKCFVWNTWTSCQSALGGGQK